MNFDSKIYVAGHTGLLGSAIVRHLKTLGYNRIIVVGSDTLDLRDQKAVETFFNMVRPDHVIMAAAVVGGIMANENYPATFFYDNAIMTLNVLNSAHKHCMDRLLFIGSSCIYPRDCPQPISEDMLMTGPLEETNRGYAVAKIAGLEMCRTYRLEYENDYVSVMMTNLYGPGDRYDPNNSHVIPALLEKIHTGKITETPSITLWGTGKPRRDFLYVDDAARGCVDLLLLDGPTWEKFKEYGTVNMGTGKDIDILTLADKIKECVGYEGGIVWDADFPDGTPRKMLDISRLLSLYETGDKEWSPRGMEEGLRLTYEAAEKGGDFQKRKGEFLQKLLRK